MCNQISEVGKINGSDELSYSIRSILWSMPGNIVLYEMSKEAIRFRDTHGDVFDIKVLLIQETIKTIENNLGTKLDPRDKRRVGSFKKYKDQADFIGTSQEVLDYILSFSK